MRAVVLDIKGMEDFDLSPISALVDELVVYEISPENQVAERISGFEIVITNKTPLTSHSIMSSSSLKLICVLATGTNVVDKTSAVQASIPVCNAVAYGVDSVVQHVFSLILALHTNLLTYNKDVRSGKWQRSTQFCFLDHPVIELKDKTIGIIGYGHLGKGVARIAEAFGMKVIIAQSFSGKKSQSRVNLKTLLNESDVISLHCPLTDKTQDLFNTEAFHQMKQSAFLINAARGGIVNEQALVDALKEGQIAGAAVDVLTEEPPVNGNVLLEYQRPNLIVTPHIAWGSYEARQRIIQQTAENISGYLNGKIINQVTF